LVIDDEFLARLTVIESQLALQRAETAAIIGIPSSEMRSGAVVPTEIANRIESLARIAARVTEFFVEDAVREWLTEPNHALLGETPLQSLKAGRLDGVEAVLIALDCGIYA
jgi:hypothetical protein